jgi:putative ABC transport system permease protein
VESNQILIIILTINALGILGIALVNFINLSITATISRTREMGIKKVHGATGSHFLRQIITESLLTSLGALLLGIFLTTTLLPFFNRLFETSLHFDLRGTPYLSLILIAIWGGIGLISGLVPSTFWARGRLVQNLQGKFFTGMKMGVFRYSSIILQFVIALVLISGTLLIRKQINYMTEMDPKFDRENVVTAETGYWQFKDAQKVTRNLAVIARELERSPNVESVSFSQNVPGLYHENFNIFYPEGKSETEVLYLRKAYVGEDYFKTFGIPVLSGDGFDKGTASKDRTAVINKTALNALGMENAGGQVLREGSETGEPYRIIGVIDDFSYQGVQNAIQPLAHFLVDNETPIEWSYLSVRAIPGASMEVLELLKAKWQEFLPEGKLDYFFADEKLHEYYKEYEKINTLITWFSMLAIALSCMGLYALSSYTAARRTKEIGIRKVNGATILQIIALLNKDFVRWVALAFIIAVPFSWFAMNKWLEGFAHKTGISWWIFATAGCLALTIALLTISSQSIRAAMSNPAEVLRDE